MPLNRDYFLTKVVVYADDSVLLLDDSESD